MYVPLECKSGVASVCNCWSAGRLDGTVILGDLTLDGVQKRLELILVRGLSARRTVHGGQLGGHDWVAVPEIAVSVGPQSRPCGAGIIGGAGRW